eukprot:7043702-Karenia_brevis.AAC.1
MLFEEVCHAHTRDAHARNHEKEIFKPPRGCSDHPVLFASKDHHVLLHSIAHSAVGALVACRIECHDVVRDGHILDIW